LSLLTCYTSPDMKKPDTKRVYLRAIERLSRLDKELSSNRFPNLKKLSEKLEVSERTVKRDLQILKNEFNAPIESNRRKGGYCYSKIGWTLPLQEISEGELLAFFIAENALKLTGNSAQAIQLKTALSKIASKLPAQISINLATLGENISFQNMPSVSVSPQTLNLIAVSSLNQTPVEFDYFSPHSQEKTHRIADVHLLHNFIGDWYAISFDHEKQQFRDFNVGRMSNLTATNDYFDTQKSWNPDEYLQKGFFMMRGGRLTTVEILFDSYQAQWVRERKFFNQDEKREELPDGSLRLSFQIGENGLEAVSRFCLQYAGNCIAEKPKRLREIVNEKLKLALMQHNNYEK
jgi:predicted DNA-binding transcriptional regulator YafY